MNEFKSQSHFEKILVPVDGSRQSLFAEELAADIAKEFESRITVIHVVSHDYMPPRIIDYEIPSSVVSEITGWFLEKGEAILSNAEALFREEGLEVDSRLIRYEDPAETILRVAKEENYSLVIMGDLKKSESERSLLGSVAEKVLRHAECPVLIVKKETRPTKILVAVDGSEAAELAVDYGAELALGYGADITLLNVQESSLFGFKPEVVREVGNKILSKAAERIKSLEPDTKLQFGDPSETIMRVAQNQNYDLVVMGSRGLSGVERFFLGSVSDDVTRHGTRSVLIVR
ncbi:MAG: universal stress protein [Thermoproteota archaeon]